MPINSLSGALRLPDSGLNLWLLPEGAVFDATHQTLFVADVHLGKADSFRRHGIPVPSGTNQRGLDRLSAVVKRCEARALVFLGDLVHDYLPAGHAVYDQLSLWRARHRAVQMTLVIGNHDRKAGTLPVRCEIDSVSAGTCANGLCLLHEPVMPAENNGEYGLAGHIHPVTYLRSRNDSLRVRCFWAQAGLLVLPAFGEFTGGYRIQAQINDAVYVTDGDAVHRLPGRRERKRAA